MIISINFFSPVYFLWIIYIFFDSFFSPFYFYGSIILNSFYQWVVKQNKFFHFLIKKIIFLNFLTVWSGFPTCFLSKMLVVAFFLSCLKFWYFCNKKKIRLISNPFLLIPLLYSLNKILNFHSYNFLYLFHPI